MPARRAVLLVAPLVALAVLAAVAVVAYQAGTRASGSAAPSASAPGTTADPDHLKAQPIDTGFAADMIDHHDQAVQMALLVIDRATTSAVRTLAVEIATSQRRESGILLQFLRDRGIVNPDPNRTSMAWMGEPVPHDQMPGLATKEQLLALTNATGAEVDRIFLDLMIRHHQGGVHMAQFAADHAETQDLRDLASRMVVDQQREIGEMQQLQTP